MMLVSAQVLAATVQAAPALASPGIPNSQDQLIQVSLALAAVVALIYLVAWFVKRKQGIHGISNIPMKTLGVLPMGVKEKIILVEVGGKQLLLGMTAANINTLATFDEPIVEAKSHSTVSFSQKFKEILLQQKQADSNQTQAVKANHEDNV